MDASATMDSIRGSALLTGLYTLAPITFAQHRILWSSLCATGCCMCDEADASPSVIVRASC